MPQLSRPRVVVALPAYNEEKYIGTIVLKVGQYADEVIVVDDGSTDQTTRIAKLAGATVIRHGQNIGKGASIQTILVEAKKRNPDVLVLLDADSQHNPDEIPALIGPIVSGDSDLVIGSREVQRDKTPFYRHIGRKVLLYATHILSKNGVTDSESGFRALSGKAIFELQLKENGFAIETEMIVRATDKGLKVTEVPISNIYIRDGSTLNPVTHGVGVLGRIIVMISERRPLFFFGLSGGASVVAGLIGTIMVPQALFTGIEVALVTAMISMVLLTIGTFSIVAGIILNVLIKRRG